MSIKFHEKNQAIFMGLQNGSGGKEGVTSGATGDIWHAVDTSLLGSDTAVACTSITGDPTRETGSYAYLGDSLSRDEYTFEKDKYVDLQIDTFQTILANTTLSGTDSADSPNHPTWTVNKEPLFRLFQICGGAAFSDVTNRIVTITNASDSPDYGTVDYRKSSPDDGTNDKLYKFWDLRGSVDVTASVGEVPSLKFSLKGNAVDPIPVPKQAADFGTQTTRVASSILPSTIITAQIIEIDPSETWLGTALPSTATFSAVGSKCRLTFTAAHGEAKGSITRLKVTDSSSVFTGEYVAYAVDIFTLEFHKKGNTTTVASTNNLFTLARCTAVAKSFCFSTLTAPNFFGFDYQRYTTGCDQGFSKGGVPTDVTVSMLEDQANAPGVFLPDVNAGKFFAVVLKFGKDSNLSAPKQAVTYMWDKLQLANVKQGKIASYLARDCSFRNTGNSYIFYQ
jgi:hypothetical protein